MCNLSEFCIRTRHAGRAALDNIYSYFSMIWVLKKRPINLKNCSAVIEWIYSVELLSFVNVSQHHPCI